VSIFKKSTSHDEGGNVSKGSGKGKKKASKDKKLETIEVQDVVDQSTTVIVRLVWVWLHGRGWCILVLW